MAAGSRVAVSVDDTVTDGRVVGYEEREQMTRYTMRTDAASEGSCTRSERCAKLADGHSTRFNIENGKKRRLIIDIQPSDGPAHSATPSDLMARATAETPRSAAHVLSWLRRCRHEELQVERVLDSVRSVAGVVPLGGRVGGTDGATPPATPRNSALTLFEAGKDADGGEESTTEQSDEKLWDLLLSSCQLPSSGGQQELRKALETLRDAKDAKRLNVERLQLKFFAARRDFFAVRIELLRAARKPQHPNSQAAEEIVDELLKEGLREALLDEMHGRQFYQPPRFTGVGAAERKALVAWELQFVKEEALLRELLLLTLVASREKATLESAVKIAKTVHSWEVRVFEDVFTASTLALPVAQESARLLTQVGVLVALRLLHTAGAVQDHAALQQSTTTFFLTDLCGLDAVPSPVPGVLLLAWATLLGRQYREIAGLNRRSEETKELEAMLQQTLVAAEKQHSFHYLNALLRSLVLGNDFADSDNVGRQPFLQPLSLHAKTLWALPNVAASSGIAGGNATQTQPHINPDSSSIYQHVVAAFLNEMLASLRYMENLEGAQQLHAMVKFVLPVLSNASVAQQTLGIDVEDSNMTDIVASGESAALRELLTKTRAFLPDSLLSCVQMFTALCCNYQDIASPVVLRQVFKYFSKPRAGLEGQLIIRNGVRRHLPPSEYYCQITSETDRIQCTRSFAYEDDEARLVVPAETVGIILRSGDEVQVEWLIDDEREGSNPPSMWDLLMQTADNFVAGLQSGSFAELHRTNTEDVNVLTSFFEFVVQLGQQHDGGQFVLAELKRRWGEARLRRWWFEHHLPSPEVHVGQLLRQQVSLSMLLRASRENLVSWGIRDRYTREKIVANLGDIGGTASGSYPTSVGGNPPNSITHIGVDGGVHMIRLLLGVLDGFLHSPSGAAIDDRSGAYLHLVTASFIALRTLLATPAGVDLLMSSSLGGGQEECVNLIVKSAKKLFELQERIAGEYPVVLATQDIFMSVVRWFLSKEAQTLANPASSEIEGYHAFVATERLWLVGAAEFAIEVLSTHESWKFISSCDRCEIAERCFRLLYVLVLPRKHVGERNDMISAFEVALHETLSTDMSILMKLLRSSCAVLSSMEGHMGNWNSIAMTDNDEDDNASKGDFDGHFPLVYETEIDCAGVNLVRLEALVTTSLRFLALLVGKGTAFVNAQVARKIMLTPIDDGGPKKRKSLTIVTLCGGYLGYSVEKAPEIAYWSLQILQQAAIVLDYRLERESRDFSSMHSLVALFHGYQDLPFVRGIFSRLLRVSSPRDVALQKEVIEMLTLCLDHQPGFLALLLFGDDRKDDATANNAANAKTEEDPLPFVTLLERFFGASEQLLEQSSDLFCALLTFLVQVWEGAIHNGLGLHLKIMAAVCECSTFWPNVTRALKIHMPVESVEERGLLDMELAAATVQGRCDVESPSDAYTGRSSAYGYLARGLILQLVSYEWHNKASKHGDHPLVIVLESFRKEGLYAHWLRTFTRLDYSPAQLEQYAATIRRGCNVNSPTSNILSDVPVGGISLYLDGLICDTNTLKWQLSAGGDIKLQASSADVRALKLVQWSNLQAAYLHAQLFSLAKWKVFMELCSIQTGSAAESSDKSSESSPMPRRLKRKESMISSPPRSSVMGEGAGNSSRMRLTGSASSASSSESVLASSRFSGDRTSFGMIQVLADVIKTRVAQHENQDEALDYFVLLHLHDLVQLFVSMLHHQLCLVVRKTRDPKLSQTRQRLDASSTDSNLKLNAEATLELLDIVEKTTSAVRESIVQIAREVELVRLGGNGSNLSASSIELTAVPLIGCLVTDFDTKMDAVTDGLYKSLLTAALLLARHLIKINHQGHAMAEDTEMESVGSPKSLLQVKLIAHCMNIITLCDNRPKPTATTQALFQLSWCLFQEVLDSFSRVDVPKPKLRMASALQMNPFMKELEHDQKGMGALFHLLVQRFRPSSYSKEVAARQEEACQVLRGLTAVAWNPDNAELFQRVMLTYGSSSRLRLLPMLATQLLPLLQAQMEREEVTSNLRGYMLRTNGDMEDQAEDKSLVRSVAHRMWCHVLDFVGGLLRLQAEGSVESEEVDVWDFMSHAESLLLAAVQPSTDQRLTRAVVVEHKALLRFLSALSGSTSRRKHWRQAFPTNVVVLMEQSRQLLRRACVLLGSSSMEISRRRKERTQKGKSPNNKSVAGMSLIPKSPRSPRSPSAFSYAHQTLLHDHLQAVQNVEKRNLTEFHRGMESELVDIVRLASLLLTKWTSSLTDRDVNLVVNGVRHVDEEQLVPLLAYLPPSEARSMNGNLGLGHLSLAMDFMLDQLLADEEDTQPKEAKSIAVLANGIDTCALLFLKTYLLYTEQYELVKRDREELSHFVRQFNARLSGDQSGATVGIDAELLGHIGKRVVCSLSSYRATRPSVTVSSTLTATLDPAAIWDVLGQTAWELGGGLLGRMAQFAHGISALDVTPSAALSAPVWLLGRRYDDVAAADLDAYKRHFEAILWFTYRRDFPQMTPYDFTSDAGWGCMLRSAQMLLGQALQRRLLGRDWRLPALFEAEMDARLPDKYVTLLRWFADLPDVECRYSIHHMVKLGMQYDKLPGEWYGPTTAAQVLRDLVNLHRREFGGELAMYVPQEGVVYTDDVTRLCVSHIEEDAGERETEKNVVAEDGNAPEFFDPLLHPPTAEDTSDWSTALLILIPLRLGLEQVNECYVPALEKTFALPQSVGIIGGKKGHSVYFVGTQQDQLHLLDPHDVHPAPELNSAFPTATHLRTVHSSRPLVMNVAGIDPSLALGFLCETRADYEDFERRVRILHDEVKADGGMCPFSVAAHRPDYAASGGDLLMADCLSGDDMNEDEIASATGGVSGAGEDEEDDYVLL